ncbi:MAG TPA: phosphate ABC transporter substrate-binding/OmpA family protein [Blastocatellia bacterium]|nr:phosphate ABC transporter substrate-binding/OmpA family protein [Blastocatellia bacterium]
MKIGFVFFVGLWLGIATLSCKQSPKVATAKIRVTGSETIASAIGENLVKEFSVTNFDCQAEVEGNGTANGIAALIAGECEIAMASRPVSEQEKKEAAKVGIILDSRDREYLIGFDALAILVNPSNRVSELDRAQLQAIFSGKLRDWSEVRGGQAAPIHVLIPDARYASHQFFKKQVLGNDLAFAAEAEVVGSSPELRDRVAGDANAITFVSFAFAGTNKILAVRESNLTQALMPTCGNVRDQSYWLTRMLYLYSNGEASGAAKKFVNYVLGTQGQELLARSGFVNLTVSGPEGEFSRWKFDTVIRFHHTSMMIDSLGKDDLVQVANQLNQLPGKIEVELIGYTDSTGPAALNEMISIRRANCVAEELRAIVPHLLFNVIGRGAEDPIDTNETAEGRQRNRRVEIWIIRTESGAKK